ncbi:uncharacterized protein LOC112891452 isoform X3 [Panicum hallii]|uniref:uncharacterized protein LOC112891452 isoform X3 n=1 Tax=Panicum hallii TaxID=206008 RepID=UPI000DF4EE79|nr:uncharacterized protein LOC112891452 isoform X3 [Panicum hallii]
MVPDGSINRQCTKSRQVKFSSSNPTPTRMVVQDNSHDMNNIYSQVTPGFESAMAHEASRVEQQFGMHRFQVSAETPTGPMGSTSKFIIPSSGYPPNILPRIVLGKHKSRSNLIKGFKSQTDVDKLREPDCEIIDDCDSPKKSNKKTVTFAGLNDQNDVTSLEDDNEYVPDSISPSQAPSQGQHHVLPSTVIYTQDYNKRLTPELGKPLKAPAAKCIRMQDKQAGPRHHIENLLADPDEASEYTLSRAFRGSKKARPYTNVICYSIPSYSRDTGLSLSLT